jgi:hypothetical protein
LINKIEEEEDELTKEDEAKMKDLCNVMKEKHSKYFGYIKGIEYVENVSCTVNIAFPLEFKKVLMITIAEGLLHKILVRSVAGIERCTLI